MRSAKPSASPRSGMLPQRVEHLRRIIRRCAERRLTVAVTRPRNPRPQRPAARPPRQHCRHPRAWTPTGEAREQRGSNSRERCSALPSALSRHIGQGQPHRRSPGSRHARTQGLGPCHDVAGASAWALGSGGRTEDVACPCIPFGAAIVRRPSRPQRRTPAEAGFGARRSAGRATRAPVLSSTAR